MRRRVDPAMDSFKLHSDYRPTGDQPEAIDALVAGIENGIDEQVLLGVTGSGKTFTMANVIARLNRPTLVLARTPTPSSKRTAPSTTRSNACATARPRASSSGGT